MSHCLYHYQDPLPPDLGEHRHYWACTCQPPTLWGPTLLYHCECCERPRAALKYMLCPDCQKHEYAHHVTVQADHQQLDEDEDLALTCLRAGGGILMPTHRET